MRLDIFLRATHLPGRDVHCRPFQQVAVIVAVGIQNHDQEHLLEFINKTLGKGISGWLKAFTKNRT
jgi:hypothetical protein